jgi:hypothetical protein
MYHGKRANPSVRANNDIGVNDNRGVNDCGFMNHVRKGKVIFHSNARTGEIFISATVLQPNATILQPFCNQK